VIRYLRLPFFSRNRNKHACLEYGGCGLSLHRGHLFYGQSLLEYILLELVLVLLLAPTLFLGSVQYKLT
jgi:hypothetical protein